MLFKRSTMHFASYYLSFTLVLFPCTIQDGVHVVAFKNTNPSQHILFLSFEYIFPYPILVLIDSVNCMNSLLKTFHSLLLLGFLLLSWKFVQFFFSTFMFMLFSFFLKSFVNHTSARIIDTMQKLFSNAILTMDVMENGVEAPGKISILTTSQFS